MRKILLFTAALLCAASMWAVETEGPWTLMGMNSRAFSRDLEPPIVSLSYNNLDGTYWTDAPRFWNDDDGIGYTIDGSSVYRSMLAVFSTYSWSVNNVPTYTRLRKKWTFQLGSKSAKHHNSTCLYGMPDDHNALKALVVDATNHYANGAGADYLLALPDTNSRQDGNVYFTSEYTYYFDFDNRRGSSPQTKTWYIMLAFMTGSGDAKSGLYEWGSFRSRSDGSGADTYYYYKYVTFDANGGEGSMDEQEIEMSGALTPNTFTREHYTFAGGWATSPEGPIAYNDGGVITATANSKGPVTLYAVWKPGPVPVMDMINAIGTVEYTAESKAKIDKARAAYNGLTADEKEEVTNYEILTAAEATYNAINNVVTLINAIGTVTYTSASKAKIDAARAAYDALDGTLQAWVINYATLTAAERAYAILDAKGKIAAIGVVEDTEESRAKIIAALSAYGILNTAEKAHLTAAELETLQAAVNTYDVMNGKSTIRFVDKDDNPLRDQVIALDYPTAPTISGFTFDHWQIEEKSISDKTITIQAVYTKNDPTDLDETIVNGKSSNRKLIKDGDVYILTDEFVYTINGQRVK